MAVAVGAAVAGAVGGAIGGGVGGGASAGGGGGGGCLPLITQVQFLNVLGRVGGTNGSEGMASFTEGFGWANYEISLFGLFGFQPSARRRRHPNIEVSMISSFEASPIHHIVFAGLSSIHSGFNISEFQVNNQRRKRKQTPGSAQTDQECAKLARLNQTLGPECDEWLAEIGTAACDLATILPNIEQVCTCLMVLGGVSIFRTILCIVVGKVLKKEVPTSLMFPMWEGPVFLSQYLAICDSMFNTILGTCSWHRAVGMVVIALVLCFSSFSLVTQHVWTPLCIKFSFTCTSP